MELKIQVAIITGASRGMDAAAARNLDAAGMGLASTDNLVSCIEPGLVLTELHHDWEVHSENRSNIREPLQPEDIARCIRFMLEQPPHVRIRHLLVLPRDQQI